MPHLGVQSSLAAPDIRLGRVDELGALKHLPEDVEQEEDGHADVGGEEGGKLSRPPWGDGEDLEAVEEDDEDEVDEGDPGTVRLEPALEDQRVAVDALGDECLAELDERDADAAPGEEVGNGHQVLEPVEDGVGASGHTHEGEQRDGRGDADTVDGNARGCALEKEPGGLSVLRNSKQISGTGVQEGVTSRGGGCQDDSVDNVREHRDGGILHGNNPWRALRTLGVGIGQLGVVAGDGDTNDEGAEDIEEQNTPEDTTNGLGDVLAGVGGLTSSDCDHLDTSVREGGVDKRRPQTSEATSGSCANVFLHRTLLPVSESEAVMVGSTTKHDDKTRNEQTEKSDDLDRSKDKLSLAIDTYCKDVEADDEDNDERNPDGGVVFLILIPERHQDSSGRDFGTESDGALVPGVPADSEANSSQYDAWMASGMEGTYPRAGST